MSSLVRLLFAISVFTLMATLPGLDVVLPLRWGHENTPVVGKTSTMTDQQLTEYHGVYGSVTNDAIF